VGNIAANVTVSHYVFHLLVGNIAANMTVSHYVIHLLVGNIAANMTVLPKMTPFCKKKKKKSIRNLVECKRKEKNVDDLKLLLEIQRADRTVCKRKKKLLADL
jgi:hypothetical protein